MPETEKTKHRDESKDDSQAALTDATSSDSPSMPELSVSPNSIEGLFLQALQLQSPTDREAFVDRNCQNDPENRKRVLALLRAHADAGNFLENPAVDRPTNAAVSLGFLKASQKEGVLGAIGPYEVLEVIGRGGMGIVLRANDPKLNRIVAVKVLLPELASNPNSRRRFMREAQAAAAISHPHVVAIHAVDESDQDPSGTPLPPFLVMECIVGQSLQQKLDRVGPLRFAEIVRITRQISDGLAAAHQQGLVHRDIKPANILLENGVERVKITDFGLARAIDDITVTRTGEVCGTPQYMSPEQANGDRVDHRSDLFSLGCVMYAMCTGHSPFRGDTMAHVIKRVTQDSPRPIGEQNPEIPQWFIRLVNRLLEKNSNERFQSAADLVSEIDQFLSAPSTLGNEVAQPEVNHFKQELTERVSPAARQSLGSSRQRWAKRLLWTSAFLVVTGFACIMLLAVDSRLLSRMRLSEQNLLLAMCGVFATSIVVAVTGVLLSNQSTAKRHSIPVLVMYVLLGPFGIVLWLMDREAHDRARQKRAEHSDSYDS